MVCDSAPEFVSALCDGETIPVAVAEHISTCHACQGRLNDYLSFAVKLRLTASRELCETITPRVWTKPQNRLAAAWQKGWGTMRIPRLAFAILIAGVLALASGLAVVKVRARDEGTVVLLTVSTGSGQPAECALSTVDKRRDTCASIGKVVDYSSILGYKIRLLARSDSRVKLGIRTRTWALVHGSGSYSIADIDRQPQQQFWFEPGDTLKVDVPGLASLAIKGNWLDHMPSLAGTHTIDPGPEELRIISPLLLEGKDVIGDMEGGAVTEDKPDQAVWIHFPKQGSYLISLSQLKGAIQGDVRLNRITFEDKGRRCVLLTGTPITRANHAWVLHQPDPNPRKVGLTPDSGFIGSRPLVETTPGVWVPRDLSN
ncbi:MAG TPA: hypothetical protein VGM02_14730 [Acidobacteriaceae bacterium]|jgi:hypothetical protein